MKLFEMEGFLRGKCLPGEMKVNETNAEYLVRKFAEADAKCAALAAENAGLKSKAAELVHEASEVYSAYNSTITEPDGDFMDMQTLQEMQCVETPATDAFLAEVRASGVEMFATWNDKHIKNGVEHKESLTAVSHAARGFAAQLRKGVQS